MAFYLPFVFGLVHWGMQLEDREIFFERHPDPMCIFDRESLGIIDVNAAALAKYGYNRAEFLALTLADLRPAEDLPRLKALLEIERAGHFAAGNIRHRTKSGQVFEVEIISHPVTYKKRNAEMVMVRDVSEIRAAERAAQQAREREEYQFKTLFEAVPGSIAVIAADTHIVVAASDAFLAMAGIRREDLVGANLFDKFPDAPGGDGSASLRASLHCAAVSGSPDVMPLQRYAVERPANEGGGFVDRYFSVVNTPLLPKDRSVQFILHRVEEVTELVKQGLTGLDAPSPETLSDPSLRLGLELLQRSDELKAANTRLQGQAANLHTAERLLKIGFWQIDATGALHWSYTMFDLYGVTPDTFSPTTANVFALIHPDDQEMMIQGAASARQAGGVTPAFTFRTRRPDGELIWIRGVSDFTVSPDGPVIFGVSQDVTDQVKAERRLHEATESERLAARLARLGGWSFEIATKRLYWSDATSEIHGELPGYSPSTEDSTRHIAPEYRDRVATAFAACIQNGEYVDEVLQIITSQNKRVWVRATGEPEYDKNGKIVLIRGAFQDISEIIAVREESSRLAQRLAQTLEAMDQAFVLLDKDWHFSFVNAQAELILKSRRADLLGKVIWDVLPRARKASFGIGCERVIATGQPHRFDCYFPKPFDIMLDISVNPTPDGLAIYFRDVTEDRAKTEQLRLLQLSVSHLNDAVLITEADPLDAPHGPKIVYVNEAFTRMTGYPVDAVIGKTPRMLQGKDTQRGEIERLIKAIKRNEPVKAELINYDINQRPFWVEMTINPVLNDKGVVTHLVSIQRDITERKNAELAIKLSEERFRIVSNASNAVIWDYNQQTDTIWYNANLEKQFGHATSEKYLPGTFWDDRVHPDDRERVVASMNAAIAQNTASWTEEYRYRKADGSYAEVKDRATFIRDDTGKLSRIVGEFEDITKQNADADRRRQSLKLEAMGQLTGGIAHDFNNLLTIILGNNDLLVESLTDEHQRELAQISVGAAERAAGLSRQLLAFARKQPLEPRLVEVDEVIASLHSILNRAVMDKVEVRHIRAKRHWRVELDVNQLEVAVLNLAINARDAMPEGGTLTIRTREITLSKPVTNAQNVVPPGQYVLICLTDTGTGMSPETIKRAFEPFFSTKKVGMGSGLGLSMVYGFAIQSGGHIQIHSTPGQGTTFYLCFPRSLKETPNPAPKTARALLGKGKESILVVEDDRLVRNHLIEQLRAMGYGVTSAESAPDALKIVKSDLSIDLLLTDILMPGDMTGKQLAAVARDLRPGIKVLFASGYSEDMLPQDGRPDQGFALLHKPFRLKDLARKVRAVLDVDV